MAEYPIRSGVFTLTNNGLFTIIGADGVTKLPRCGWRPGLSLHDRLQRAAHPTIEQGGPTDGVVILDSANVAGTLIWQPILSIDGRAPGGSGATERRLLRRSAGYPGLLNNRPRGAENGAVTTPESATHPVPPRLLRLLGGRPRGVRLDERSFVTRHRIISAVLAVHPLAARRSACAGVGGWLLWGQLAAIVGWPGGGSVRASQVACTSAVSLGLMIGADVLVHVSGGLTDMHIWFYALLALVALYQAWTPFLLAVGFVAVHHAR